MDQLEIPPRNRKITGDGDRVLVNPSGFHKDIAWIWEFYLNFSIDFKNMPELKEREGIKTKIVQSLSVKKYESIDSNF